jgi:hypothetical protein
VNTSSVVRTIRVYTITWLRTVQPSLAVEEAFTRAHLFGGEYDERSM